MRMLRSKCFPLPPIDQLPSCHNHPSWFAPPPPPPVEQLFQNDSKYSPPFSEISATSLTNTTICDRSCTSDSNLSPLDTQEIDREHESMKPNCSMTMSSTSMIYKHHKRYPRRKHSQYSVVSSIGKTDIPPSALTNHQRIKNLQLLRSWTDEGHYSRVKAMTIASILYNRKVTEGDLRAELTPKEKFAYKKFCLQIQDKLEMITSQESSKKREPFSERTLRKIWHLYALYSKAWSDEIWDEGNAKSDITSRAIAHLVKRAIVGPDGIIGSKSSSSYSFMSTLKPIDPLGSVNPVLAASLKDPIQAFLVVYGRYVSTGKVTQVERLRKLTTFNEIAEEFFQKLVEPPENVDIDTFLLLLRQKQQNGQRGRSAVKTTGGPRAGRSKSSVHVSAISDKSTPLEQPTKERKTKHNAKKESVSLKTLNHQQGFIHQLDDSLNTLASRQKSDPSCVGGDQIYRTVVVANYGSRPHYKFEYTPGPTDNDVRSLQRKIQTLDGKKRICLSGCRYDVLTSVAKTSGFEIVGENDLWNINWCDTPLIQEKIMQMRRVQDMYSVFWGLNAPLQKTNHFPGMYEICRKDRLGRNLNRLKRLFPGEYTFFPETFDLPTEQGDLVAYSRRRRNNVTFIIKPESGCQGKGIFLLKNLKKLSPFAKCVCQVYIPHPLLIDGYKFDQRIYVLITCVDPLRLYIYDEGIARFATVKYEVPTEDNLEVVYMHLTNYSLNKFSESYVREGDGSKRTLSSIYQWMSENGFDVAKLSRAIDEIVVKTMLCAAPTLKHNYKTSFPKRDRGCSCFELLGFDILIDRHLNPILLEVNHSPSFHLDLPVDRVVKKALLRDVLNMVYLGDELAQTTTTGPIGKKKSKKLQPQQQQKQQQQQQQQQQPPSKKSASFPEIESHDMDCHSGLSAPLQRQFKHEMKNRGQFRLIYSSDRPGRFQKMHADNSYCGYNVMSNLPSNERQMVAFDRDANDAKEHKEQWRPQRTYSTMKVTKTGQKYVETRVVDYSTSTQNVQKFREIRDKFSSSNQNQSSQSQQNTGRSRSKVSAFSNSNKSVMEKEKKKKKQNTNGNNNSSNRQNSLPPFTDINSNYYDSTDFINGNSYIQPRWSSEPKNKQKIT